MEDAKIVALYWERAESALTETQNKYGAYCRQIARNILHNEEDAEECVNDTYMRAWNAIPPHKPARLSTFLGKITRNLALNRYYAYTAQKRGEGQMPAVLEEWQQCVPVTLSDRLTDDLALKEAFDRFLRGLPQERRRLFLRRYWYVSSIREIAQEYGMGESRVKMQLLRTRNELKEFLEKEGIDL